MDCPACGVSAITFDVPPDLQASAPVDATAASLCPHCLRLTPLDDAPPETAPDFTRVSEAFPTGESGITMALLVGLLDSLATYRDEIESLVEHLERAGTDPLLVLDRLEREPDLDPEVPLDRRKHQLQQVL